MHIYCQSPLSPVMLVLSALSSGIRVVVTFGVAIMCVVSCLLSGWRDTGGFGPLVSGTTGSVGSGHWSHYVTLVSGNSSL